MKKTPSVNDALALVALLGLLIGGLVALVVFGPSRGAVVPPDCAIPDGGGHCTVTISLPANQSANYAVYDFTFVPTPGPAAPRDLAPLASAGFQSDYSSTRGYRQTFLYLYAVPTDLIQLYDAALEVTASGITNGNTLSLRLARPVRPYPADTVLTCSVRVNGVPLAACDPSSLITYCNSAGCNADEYFLRYQYPDGTPSLNTLDTDTIAASTSEVVNGTATLTATMTSFHSPLASNKFLVIYGISGGSAVLQQPAEVRATLRPLRYPGTVTYALNQTVLGTFSGPYDAPKRSPDVAAALNAACHRPQNPNACTAALSLSSAAGGSFYIRETLQLVNLTPAPACTSTWTCTEWTACLNQTQSRVCTDAATCTPPNPASPALSRPCPAADPCGTCTPTANATCGACIIVPCLLEWRCTDWTACTSNQQTRTCTNPCPNTQRPKPPEAQTCSQPPPPPTPWWQSWYTILGAATTILGGAAWLWRKTR